MSFAPLYLVILVLTKTDILQTSCLVTSFTIMMYVDNYHASWKYQVILVSDLMLEQHVHHKLKIDTLSLVQDRCK